MFSPLLLVRILDVKGYGQYQEFMIYATLFVTICSFGINSSLTYFLPRYPGQERQFVSQNSALTLIISCACIGLFLILRQPFLDIATFDFVFPLAAYVFFFVNLNWLEHYWVAKRRTDLVLYYSAARLILRITVLLTVAWLTRDVNKILWAVVSAEVLRFTVVAVCLLRARLLTIAIDIPRTKEQLRFAGPIGFAALMQQGSRHVGKLFIGSMVGPAALAYYAVASYPMPIVRIIRGSISDVVFPEMVRIRDDRDNALRLWQRLNIVFCAVLFPTFVFLTFYAELFITTLFTAQYLSAVPVFQIYLLWLLRSCFNMDVLLRTRGRTGFMFTGNGLAVVINVALMVLLYRWLGLIGPAIAYVVSEVLLELYNATLLKKEFGLKIITLVDWLGIWRVTASCIVSIPLLIIAKHLPGPALALAAVGSLSYVTACWFIAYRMGVADIGRIARFATSRGRKHLSPL
jgi:O-antigen/teichoic acid export membrane protein